MRGRTPRGSMAASEASSDDELDSPKFEMPPPLNRKQSSESPKEEKKEAAGRSSSRSSSRSGIALNKTVEEEDETVGMEETGRTTRSKVHMD